MPVENIHIIVGVLAIVAVIILYIIFTNKPIHNIGSADLTSQQGVESTNAVDDVVTKLSADDIDKNNIIGDGKTVDQTTLDKLGWKNKAGNVYAASSYVDGKRSGTMSELDAYYVENSGVTDPSFIQNNDKFEPIDETGGNSAAYSGNGHVKTSQDDLFKVENVLPQETNKNWFEVMPEPISVKNKHLINTIRPIGINTIGSSHRNASLDLRGNMPCPKFNVGIFNQSSIEPDLSIKGLS